MAFILFLALLAGAQAHTFFQKVSVNGVDQGDTYGVRLPTLNSPINSVDDPNFACNSDITTKDSNIITIPQGAKVGTWWDHEIGGAPPGDPDSPVASSHKGPILAYLAAVDDPVGASGTGLNWFKVGEEGLNNGQWAVDNLKANGGWWSFTMPSCVPAGKYLMRAELIALHGAYAMGAAQFYTECAQIEVTGSGTSNPATVSFPGAYSASDPGIFISIYDGNGQPTNDGRPYTIPGPPLIDCSGSTGSTGKGGKNGSGGGGGGGGSNVTPPTPTTMATMVSTSASGAAIATASASASTGNTSGSNTWSGTSSTAGLMEQCGGDGWTGAKTCSSGTCTPLNQWASLCM